MNASAALRAGARRATSRLWPASALFATGAGEVFAGEGAVLLALAAARSDNPIALSAGAVGLVLGWLLMRLCRAAALYRALGPPNATWASSSVRAVGYFILSAALELMLKLWWWGALIASGVAYAASLGKGAAIGPSLAVAIALSGGALASLFFAVWADVALARSTAEAEPFSASLMHAARAVVKRPWPVVVIVMVTGGARWAISVGLGGIAAAAGPWARLQAPTLALGSQVTAGLAVALAWAVLELTRLSALQAVSVPQAPLLPVPPIPMAALVDASRGGD